MTETPPPAELKVPDKAVLYIDGNNWYHFMAASGVKNPMMLSYKKISEKIIGPREWKETRYYIGALKQNWNATDYANQRLFLSTIEKDDPRVTVHLGRLERRMVDNPLAEPLLRFLDDPKSGVPRQAEISLRRMIGGFARVETLKEKAVDVMMAADVLVGAIKDHYDAAYLLTADGDFTPVVESARDLGKKVYCVSPGGYSSELQKVATAFIGLKKDWFDDCYR